MIFNLTNLAAVRARLAAPCPSAFPGALLLLVIGEAVRLLRVRRVAVLGNHDLVGLRGGLLVRRGRGLAEGVLQEPRQQLCQIRERQTCMQLARHSSYEVK